jgi:K+-transporting ATPase ATPase A chain
MWLLPLLIVGTAVVLSIPVGLYLAWIMDGRYRPPRWLAWIESRLDTGPQSWKQYAISLLLFNLVMFVVGFAFLALQPVLADKDMLAPTTIFNTAVSFQTNTNLQHYSGEQHLSYVSQLTAILWNMFVSAAVGFCAVSAVIRGLRGDSHMGNFYVDMWRGVVYVFLPSSLLMAVLLLPAGVPMTLEPTAEVPTLEQPDASQVRMQKIARGPVAAIIPIKHLGTNGGGFFGANGAHPYENPSAWSNFLECMNILIFPFALVVMFGKMLGARRHAALIYGVMMLMLAAMIGWAIYWDSMQQNAALTAQPPHTVLDPSAPGGKREIAALAGLPVDASLGNLEGKELRFGTSAGTTFAACTTAIACGSVNCMHDSLNPLAGLTPLSGMWLNCIFGGKGVGLINLLVYLIVGVFLSGLMVGRTPEYLGKKVEAREMKLAMLAILVIPGALLSLTALAVVLPWAVAATGNTGPHGFSEILYAYTSAANTNGSAFAGLSTNTEFYNLTLALAMVIGRFCVVVPVLALAGSLAGKRLVPASVGTLPTTGALWVGLLLGVIVIVGGLSYLPALALGPVAEQLAMLHGTSF